MVGVTVNNQWHKMFSSAPDEPEFKLEKFQLLTCVFFIPELRIDCFQQWLGEKHRMGTAKFGHYGDEKCDITVVIIEHIVLIPDYYFLNKNIHIFQFNHPHILVYCHKTR